MKVLYYIQNVSHKEGSWLSLSALIKYGLFHGISPVIVAPYNIKNDSIFKNFCENNNIPVYYVNICFPKLSISTSSIKGKVKLWYFSVRFLPYKIKCALQLYEIVKREKPSIIHTNVGVLREGLWVAKFCNIPHVWHLREYQDLDFSWDIYPSKRVYERLLRKSDAIVTITDNIKSYFNLTGVKYAYTVYNGIEANVVREIQMPKEKYFLVASRISPEKGIDGIVRTFITFKKKHEEYKLVIAGDCSGDYAKSLMKKYKDEKNIKYIGWKDLPELELLMCKSTALIVNSQYEGLGRMTIEAIFRGSIVVGRNIAGTREISEKVGAVLTYENEIEFMSCLEDVCEMNVGEYRDMVEEAQKKALNLFSVGVSGKNILLLYQKLCSGKMSVGK